MLKVGSCFSGVGFWEMALKQLEIPHTTEFCVEFDKYPYASYKAIHGDVKNYGDVTKINGNEVEDIDLFVYSPPCQAFSVAGNQQGVDDHRGVLFFDALRIIQAKQPKICVMENVKGLTNKKFAETFKSMLACLTMAGYTNYWKVLNTKDFGIPQNRERVFIVSVRNDIDNGFEWPVPFDNGLRLKHMLEDEVDEKFYISDEKCVGLIKQIGDQQLLDNFKPEYSFAKKRCQEYLDEHGYIPNMINPYNKSEIKDVSPALTASCDRSCSSATVFVKEATKKGYAIATEGDSINLDQPNSLTRRGRVGVGVAQTLTTGCNQAVVEPILIDDTQGFDGVRIYEYCPTIRSQRSGLKVIEPIILDDQGGTTKQLTPKEFCPTLRAQDHGNPPKVIERNNVICLNTKDENGIQPHQQDRIYSCEGSMTTLSAQLSGRFNIVEPNETICIGRAEGIKGHDYNKRVYSPEGASPSLAANSGGNLEPKTVQSLRIRKLTPKECWRLQGATDEDFEKAAKVNSNSQLYKQAGNGLSVNVVVELLKQLQAKNYI